MSVKRRIPRHSIGPVRSQCVAPEPSGRLIGRHGVYQIIEVVHRGKSALRYVRQP